MEIRDAAETDLPAICAIYNDAVANTTAIWNETLVDVANRKTWLKARNAAGFPVLAALPLTARSSATPPLASGAPSTDTGTRSSTRSMCGRTSAAAA